MVEYHGIQGAFGFRNEVDVLHCSCVKGDGPVGRIIANRGRNGESFGELGIDTYFIGCIQSRGKLHFYAVHCAAVREHIVLDGLGRLERLINALAALFSGEDVVVVCAAGHVIGDMVDDHRGFLLINHQNGFGNELFGVPPEHIKSYLADALQDGCNSAAGQMGSLRNLANQVIRDTAAFPMGQRLGFGLCSLEGITTLHLILVHLRFLGANRGGVLQFRDKQLLVNGSNGLGDKFLTLERTGVGILVVNQVPQLLELFLLEVFVQRILLDLCYIGSLHRPFFAVHPE